MTQIVKVPLASNAIYVSGTVNGIDKIWTREEGNWWSTTADRSDDGAYRVALSIVYGDGKTAEDSITLYYGLVLVTDRTQNDVINGTKNGYYNSEDLNRVGGAMVYLRDRLNENGYNVDIDPNSTWLISDIQTYSDMTLYLNYVSIIRNQMSLPSYTPEVPDTMEHLTFSKANDIEKILEIVDEMLTKSLTFIWYSGDLYSGEVL